MPLSKTICQDYPSLTNYMKLRQADLSLLLVLTSLQLNFRTNTTDHDPFWTFNESQKAKSGDL